MTLTSTNPATGDTLQSYDSINDSEVATKLEQADQAYQSWSQVSLDKRANHLRQVAVVLRGNKAEYARLLTSEMGKVLAQAESEVEKCAATFDHYADNAEQYLSPRPIDTEGTEAYVRYDPLGVILTIMPWNFAFWQALRMAAPILLAGNTIVLKHASNVPGSALALEQLFVTAGLPKHIYQTLLIGSAQIEAIIDNDIIKGVSLTGSEKAGSIVGSQAGKALKPCVLELGGSDPSIVLDDADLEHACTAVTTSRLNNNGQSCVGAKRFLVHEAIYDDFLARLKTAFEASVVGDPMDPKTTLGPVVSQSALDELVRQITESVEAGAQVVTGGERIGDTGYFLQPTILANVTPDVPAYYEELFGPVASVIKVADDDEAVAVANATRFGLGSSIYTSSRDRANALIPRIEAGSVFVNDFVKSNPAIPFGGIKKSGFGRELSREGALAFTNVKTVSIAQDNN